MARPTKYGEAMAKPRSFRLTASDDEKFAAKLFRSKMETSEFIRDHILKNKTEVIALPPKPTKQAKLERLRLIGLVNKAGNNVNQIAHRLNSDFKAGKVTADTYNAILGALEDVSLLMKASLPKWD